MGLARLGRVRQSQVRQEHGRTVRGIGWWALAAGLGCAWQGAVGRGCVRFGPIARESGWWEFLVLLGGLCTARLGAARFGRVAHGPIVGKPLMGDSVGRGRAYVRRGQALHGSARARPVSPEMAWRGFGQSRVRSGSVERRVVRRRSAGQCSVRSGRVIRETGWREFVGG